MGSVFSYFTRLNILEIVVNHMISDHIYLVKYKEIWTKPEFNSPRNIFFFNVTADPLFFFHQYGRYDVTWNDLYDL